MAGAKKTAFYGWFVCILAALFYCYEYLLRIEPSVMVPRLMQHFHVSATGLGLLSAMYYFAYTPLQAVVGVTTDRYGPKWILTGAIGVCGVGCLIFGLAPTVYIAGVGRLFIGIGSAFAFVGVLKLAAMWLPHNRFSLFVGLATALGMIGAMIGDVQMSWLVEHYGWHRVIYLSALVAVILIPLFVLFVHNKRDIVPTSEPRLSWPQVWKGLWKVLTNRNIVLAGLAGCMLYMSLSVFGEMWGVVFIRYLTHEPKVQAAAINSMVFLGWLVGAPSMALLSEKIKSRRKLLIWGSLLAALSMSVILTWGAMSVEMLSVLLFLFGFFSSSEVACFAIARDVTSIKLAATAVGIINLFVMLGGMLLQPLAGWLLDLNWHGKILGGVREYGVHDYKIALIVIPVGLVLAMILALFVRETHPDAQ